LKTESRGGSNQLSSQSGFSGVSGSSAGIVCLRDEGRYL
jgi:hypothetical protein